MPLLIKDKAAQNLTRLPNISAQLVNYFIELHEKSLLSFDKLVDHFHWGEKFIHIKKLTSSKKFKFSHKLKTPKLTQKMNYAGYVLFILYAIGIVTNILPIPFFPNWLKIVFSICSVLLAFFCLNKADDLSESIKFLELINKAQQSDIENTE